MGHVLSKHGIAHDDSKVESFSKAKQPENTPEVDAFVGLITYCSKFIPDLATVAEPPRLVTKQSVPFKRNCQEQEAFDSLKANATLAYFHRSKNTKTQVIAETSPAVQLLCSNLHKTAN